MFHVIKVNMNLSPRLLTENTFFFKKKNVPFNRSVTQYQIVIMIVLNFYAENCYGDRIYSSACSISENISVKAHAILRLYNFVRNNQKILRC